MEGLQYIQKMKFKLILLLTIIFQISFGQKLVEKTKSILRNNVYFFEDETGPYTINLEIYNLKNNEGFIALELLDINNIRIANETTILEITKTTSNSLNVKAFIFLVIFNEYFFF